MPDPLPEKSIDSVLAIIMGGGQGSRLFPLTHNRSKPAVPLAAKCRIVDIPISNCINSGIRKMYVLTQYNSESLNRHVTSAYRFDHFGDNFVHILAAQQTPGDDKWYQGTADAVRQNLSYFLERPYKYFLILSGDQLYRMDFQLMLSQHLETGADLTIATTPVPREPARAFGLMHTDDDSRITRFVEKAGKRRRPSRPARDAGKPPQGGGNPGRRGALPGIHGDLPFQPEGARRRARQ
jgi:glucose-1-phosphate adenylyltransferase